MTSYRQFEAALNAGHDFSKPAAPKPSPYRVDAMQWADAILSTYRRVATESQVTAALGIVNADSTLGLTIVVDRDWAEVLDAMLADLDEPANVLADEPAVITVPTTAGTHTVVVSGVAYAVTVAVQTPDAPKAEAKPADRVATVLRGSVGLPVSIRGLAKAARVAFSTARRGILARFNGEVLLGFKLSTSDAPAVRTIEVKGTAYAVEPIEAGECGTAAYGLTKPDGVVYHVIATTFGTVECDCGDYTFRKAGTGENCKHGAALVAAGLLDSDIAAGREAREIAEDDASFADELADAAGEDGPLEADILDCLPFPKAGRKPFLEPAPCPLPRPLPASGRYDLPGLADAQADAYRALGTAVGNLFAEAMQRLADSIRETGAKSVGEYEYRMATLDNERCDADERAEAEAYDRGWVAAMEHAGDPAYAACW